MTQPEFVDYYELLQISPNAQYPTIQRVFKMLAMRYHPDNPETGDVERFLLLNKAHDTLADPKRRAEYDAIYAKRQFEPVRIFETKEFDLGIDGESNRRMGILCLLYTRRRNDPDDPGLSLWELEEIMGFAREHLMFAVWYLQEHNYVRMNHQGDVSITGDGVDFVEENLPKNRLAYHYLKAAEAGTSRSAMPEEAERAGDAKAAGSV